MAIESEESKKQSHGNIDINPPNPSEGGADENDLTNALARRFADYISKNNPPKLSQGLVDRLNDKVAKGGTLDDQDMADIIDEMKDYKPTTYTNPNPPRG